MRAGFALDELYASWTYQPISGRFLCHKKRALPSNALKVNGVCGDHGTRQHRRRQIQMNTKPNQRPSAGTHRHLPQCHQQGNTLQIPNRTLLQLPKSLRRPRPGSCPWLLNLSQNLSPHRYRHLDWLRLKALSAISSKD